MLESPQPSRAVWSLGRGGFGDPEIRHKLGLKGVEPAKRGLSPCLDAMSGRAPLAWGGLSR